MLPVYFFLFLFLLQTPVIDPPAPTLLSIDPSSVVQGTTVAVTFRGSGFVPQQSSPEIPAAGVGALQGISSAGATQYTDENTMTVLWRVMAPAGKYYVNIKNLSRDLVEKRSNLLPFTILPSEIPSSPEYEAGTFAGKPGGPGAADGGRESARFQGAPGGIWGDGKFLYVSDNYTIRRVEIATGVVTSIAGAAYICNYADGKGSEARLNGPGPVWDDGANLYVLEAAGLNSTIRRIAIATGEVTTVGPRGRITATHISGFGRYLYFSQGRTIFAFDPETQQYVFTYELEQIDFPVNGVPGPGSRPNPIWADEHAIYVVDNGSNDPQKPRSLIRRIDLGTFEITNIAGSGSQIGYADGIGAFARFNHPVGLWGDGAHLFVADTENRAIRRIDLATQEVSTVAGVPQPRRFPDENFPIIDGSASIARFSIPARIWGDGAFLYVTDLFVLRRVTIATGDVMTLAGSRWNTGADDGIGAAARFVNAGSITGNRNVFYVQDGLRGALRSVNLQNAGVRTIGSMAVELAQAIWADDTTIYTVNPNTGLIQAFEINTGSIRSIASVANLGISPVFYYRSIWGDGSNIYVGGNKKIYKVGIATGQVSVLAGKGLVTGASDEFLPKDGIGTEAQFVQPTGLWGDGTSLYVADTRLIRKVALSTGEVTTIAGDPITAGVKDGARGTALFMDLRGISGDGRYLYVIEFNSTRVRRVSVDPGEVTTIAGEYGKPGSEDGIGTGAHFTVPAGIWVDGANIYVSDVSTIRRLTPLPAPASTTTFTISSNGSLLTTTRGTASQVAVGYARVHFDTPASIAGTAFFGYRQNGVLVTETGVPAVGPMQRGRIYTASEPSVRTGVAIANPNPQTVTVSFFYTDENGLDFGAAATTIPSNGQISRFLDEAPFNTAPPGTSRSWTFNASAPVGVIAIRGVTNERSDFLITMSPVMDLSVVRTRVVLPQFAKGGGWTTTVTLVNPSDSIAAGEVVFLLDDGSADTRIPYTLAPRSAFTASAADASTSIQTGQVLVAPKAGQATPDGVVVFSYQRDGITISETSIPAVEPGSVFISYVEATAAVQTAIALANDGASDAAVTLSLLSVAGEDLNLRATLKLRAGGHTAFFVRQIPGFDSLPSDFRGVLRVAAGAMSSITALALRCRYNERGDFLASTMEVVDQRTAARSELMFPHFADGSGYTTEFVLFSASPQAATGTLQFTAPSGEPLLLQLR